MLILRVQIPSELIYLENYLAFGLLTSGLIFNITFYLTHLGASAPPVYACAKDASSRYPLLKINKQITGNNYQICLSFKGKVAIGKARYLLNIVYFTLGCSTHLFSVLVLVRDFALFFAKHLKQAYKNLVFIMAFALVYLFSLQN